MFFKGLIEIEIQFLYRCHMKLKKKCSSICLTDISKYCSSEIFIIGRPVRAGVDCINKFFFQPVFSSMYVFLSVCLCVCLSVCLSVSMDFCLYVWLSVCLSVYLLIHVSAYSPVRLSVDFSMPTIWQPGRGSFKLVWQPSFPQNRIFFFSNRLLIFLVWYVFPSVYLYICLTRI